MKLVSKNGSALHNEILYTYIESKNKSLYIVFKFRFFLTIFREITFLPLPSLLVVDDAPASADLNFKD